MKGNGKWTFFSIYSVPGTMLNMFTEMISLNPHHGPVKREPQFPLILQSSICRSWCWERLKAEKEERDRGWDSLMASPIQWTWNWAHSVRWWGTGKLGLPQSAAAKSRQSCPTLCDPIDGSPPGSPIPGILQARTLEWVAISFFNAWKWKVKVKSLSRVWLLVTPWTAAHQAPPPMGVSRQEYWSGRSQRIGHDWGLGDWTTFAGVPTACWRSHRLYGTHLGLIGQTHSSYCLSWGRVLKLLSSSTEVLPR